MKKVTILTATRAEYGLLKLVIIGLQKSSTVEVEIAVTGAHLSPEFGLTYKEIEKDDIDIAIKIPILLSSDSPAGVSKSMGIAMMGFADYFDSSKPDMLVVLGDRYETLAVCCAAVNARIPIAHLYGGEATEGAVDEAYRHAITKMSYLHFTATEDYRKRVIQLGEEPSRVFNVGAVGVENALTMRLLSKEELESSIGFALDKSYACVTFHPVTLENNTATEQTKELLLALDEFSGMKFIFTKANADADGRVINKLIDDYVAKHDNSVAFTSLGALRYLSTVKYAEMVIGNSSSGLVEVPSFHIPTVNIGDRQKGRIKAESVIDCTPKKDKIVNAVMLAQSREFRDSCQAVVNPYGGGNTSEAIVKIIIETLEKGIRLKKKFYDVDIEVSR